MCVGVPTDPPLGTPTVDRPIHLPPPPTLPSPLQTPKSFRTRLASMNMNRPPPLDGQQWALLRAVNARW